MKLRLKEIRKSKGLTQRQVADLAGISLSYYTEIELGKKQLNQRTQGLIAKALRVSPHEILVDDDNGERVYLMGLFDRMDTRRRALFREMAEQFAEDSQRKP